MTAQWTTSELPGLRWDPEPPDDGDDDLWCGLDLWACGLTKIQIHTMTTIKPSPEYL